MSKNDAKSNGIKTILSHYVGGAASDWKRVSKKVSTWNDIDREFENKKLGVKVSITERSDGLFYADLDGKTITARLSLSGAFDKAAKLSSVDLVMNAILDDKEPEPKLYKQAVKDGLINRFSFWINAVEADPENGIDERDIWASIYPTVRDATFKCPDYIAPLVPEANGVDECMETEWRFPKHLDTPSKLAQHLMDRGLTLDPDMAKYNPKMHAEVQSGLNKANKAPKKPGK